MKKFLKFLIILLIVFVILPVALVFIFFFDTGKMKVNYDDNFTKEKWTNALVVDSLDNTKKDKAMSFIVTEADINNLIRSSIKDNAELNKYLSQLAVDITDDHYIISASGRYFFFETRAKIHATMERKLVVSGDSQEEAYVFTVDKISLGRLSQLKGIVNFFLKTFLKNSTLDALTASLKIHSDLEHSCLFIYASDMREILNSAVAGNGGSSDFYFAFINDFLDHNLLEFDFYGNEAFTVKVNMDKLTGNDYDTGEYVCYDMKYDQTTTKLTINGQEKQLSLDTIKEAITALLDQKLIEDNEMSRVSDYLFHGYDGSYKPTADLSSIGISEAEKVTYPGFNIVNANSLESTLKAGVSSFENYNTTDPSFDLVKINEKTINDFLKTQNVFGIKYFLSRDLDNGKKKMNYIALDNAYINLYQNKSVITIGLNVNGLETFITLTMDEDTTNTDKTKLVYKPKDVYFGKLEEGLILSDKTEDLIFDTLSNAISSSTFKFDEDGTLTIAFDDIIDQAINMINTGNAAYDDMYKTFLREGSTQSIKVEGNTVQDNANVVITATRK